MDRIAIVGLGLIGGSIGLALKRAKLASVEIVGHDRQPETAGQAKKRGAVDRTEWNLIATVEKARMVIIATPVLAVRDVMQAIANDLPPGCVVTDTASTKHQVLTWAAEFLPPSVSFVGGHPMAGRETPGIEAADPDLFVGSTYCIAPSPSAHPEAVDSVVGLATLLGATPFFLDGAEHDGLVAGVSHLPFVVSTALVSAVTRSSSWREMSKLASSGYRDVTRLASGDPIMHRDVCLTNRDSIVRWIDAFVEELHRYRALVQQGGEALETQFVEAQVARNRWLAGGRRDDVAGEVPRPSQELAQLFVGRRLWDQATKKQKE